MHTFWSSLEGWQKKIQDTGNRESVFRETWLTGQAGSAKMGVTYTSMSVAIIFIIEYIAILWH